jgi:Helix-turn-helix of DDE superfamily endonuclease
MYNKVTKLNDEKFRRKTGVKRNTFEVMVKVVKESEQVRKKLSGRPCKLSYEDQVLMTLEYLREYRTYFSISEIYNISEANAYKIIKKVEDILIQTKEFRLPSRKEIYEDLDIQVVVVDATESSIERPKKSRNIGTLARKRSIHSKLR